MVPVIEFVCSVWSAPWFLECQPQRGMPSTRALLATNHSLAGRSGYLIVAALSNLYKCTDKKVAAIQLSKEHNANLDNIRRELRDLHPHDPQIVVMKHGVWRVKGIIQVLY